jgi:hypothetical protein
MITPSDYAQLRLGLTPWARQKEIIDAVFEKKRVTVRSGHGVGKTCASAALACWFLAEHSPALVITTAPTNRQVEKVLWPEVRRMWRRTLLGRAGVGRVNACEIKITDSRRAMGFSTDEPDRFQGFHCPNLLFIADEAAGVDGKIYEAVQGILTGENAHELLIGNPTTPSGFFYDSHMPGSPYHKIRISCLESPNVIAGREVVPGLTTRAWVERQKQEWGEESPAYKARVLGDFPDQAESVLIGRSWIEHAQSLMPRTDAGPKRMGVDVARFGADTTAFVIRNDSGVLHMETHAQWSTMETAGRIIALMREQDILPHRVAVDDTGVGGGVTDRLREQGFYVRAINFGGKAQAESKYHNRRTEMYKELARALNPAEGGGGFGLPPSARDLARQLADLRYAYTSRGLTQLEPKEAIKRRLGRSPDEADALALCFVPDNQSDFVMG